jgi:hypothetical protein
MQRGEGTTSNQSDCAALTVELSGSFTHKLGTALRCRGLEMSPAPRAARVSRR